MITINVEYFAVLRETAGISRETIETGAKTADELFRELTIRHGFPELSSFKVAINEDFVAWHTPLHDRDTVVFIPPVAGG